MWPLLAMAVFGGAPDVWAVNTSVGPGETKTFSTQHIEAGQHYALVTRGQCVSRDTGRTRRWREKVNPTRSAPFGTEYRLFVGRLEFEVGIDEHTVDFVADSANPAVRVEDRSSGATSMKCSLTSISIRPP